MLRLSEASQILNAHPNSVRKWANLGILKSYRIGPRRDRRFEIEDIIRFLNETKTKRVEPDNALGEGSILKGKTRGNKDDNLDGIDSAEKARLLILFIQTGDVLRNYFEAVLSQGGLSLIQMKALQLLQSGASFTRSEMARVLLLEKSDISTLIKQLEGDKLIRVSRVETDKRHFSVVITKKGRKSIEKLGPINTNTVENVMPFMPKYSAVVFEESLLALRQNAYKHLKEMNKRPRNPGVHESRSRMRF
jgi:DNA-binding MarR family transcriptional regulator